MNVRTKFEVRSFTRSSDNRGIQKIGTVPGYTHPRSLFSQIFNRLLFEWTLWTYRPNLQYVALPVLEVI